MFSLPHPLFFQHLLLSPLSFLSLSLQPISLSPLFPLLVSPSFPSISSLFPLLVSSSLSISSPPSSCLSIIFLRVQHLCGCHRYLQPGVHDTGHPVCHLFLRQGQRLPAETCRNVLCICRSANGGIGVGLTGVVCRVIDERGIIPCIQQTPCMGINYWGTTLWSMYFYSGRVFIWNLYIHFTIHLLTLYGACRVCVGQCCTGRSLPQATWLV